ncbi:hypothetical protein L596_021070 [Steinernema carpocapsae]|uniref:Uncharacterized protein n=1 Tax=Steinernema carpocapsae TaxID=34508 RepID=A0A4U5MW26_STECR|nr:hypothetical protein L596_021070 [Steinernema carpocapsae]
MPYKSDFPPVPLPTEAFGQTILNALWKHSVEMPEKAAFIDGVNQTKTMDFKTIYIQSLSVSAYLRKIHFGHGDVACLVMPNCFEFVPIFAGIALNGGAMSGASFQFTEFELERQFYDCKCSVVFCTDESMSKVLNVSKKCSFIKKIIVASQETLIDLPFGVAHITEAYDCQPNTHNHQVDMDIKRDILLLPYSRHFNKMITPYIGCDFKDEVHLIIAPLYHMVGFSSAIAALLRGSTSVFFDHFEPHTFLKAVQDYKIKFLQVVPPLMVFISKSSIVDQYDLSSVIMVGTGAAPTGKEICEDVRRRLPNVKHITQGYGMTELTTASHLHTVCEKDEKYGNSGKLCPNLEMMVVDIETKKEVKEGEKGELWIRGPTVMMGYLNRPQATADTIDDDGWLHTGDIGYVDNDGFLYVVDRLKELIKVKGLQVPPAELEDLLLTHPQIADAGVVGIPDDRDGEHPLAFVVTKNENLTEKEVQDFVKERAAKYKQLLGGVVFIRQIPKSPAGKILRRYLKDEALTIQNARNKSAKI